MSVKPNKCYTQIIIGNNNYAGLKELQGNDLAKEVKRLSSELEKTKADLSWAMSQITIKDFIIKSILDG